MWFLADHGSGCRKSKGPSSLALSSEVVDVKSLTKLSHRRWFPLFDWVWYELTNSVSLKIPFRGQVKVKSKSGERASSEAKDRPREFQNSFPEGYKITTRGLKEYLPGPMEIYVRDGGKSPNFLANSTVGVLRKNHWACNIQIAIFTNFQTCWKSFRCPRKIIGVDTTANCKCSLVGRVCVRSRSFNIRT